LIAGNVYLFAASQGVAAWFHNIGPSGLSSFGGKGRGSAKMMSEPA
jgi:hypothetical protein